MGSTPATLAPPFASHTPDLGRQGDVADARDDPVAEHRGFLGLMPAYPVTALETKLVANPEISSQLFLSLKTVQSHVSTIFRKAQVAGRTQAAIRAREAGLGDGP